MEENQYKPYLSMICSLVNKNHNFSVSVNNIEFSGFHRYSGEKIYKITLNHGIAKYFLVFYVEEDAFERWGEVPWSGRTTFRPDDWNKWEADKKLMTAWCWCIYCYCSTYKRQNFMAAVPEYLN